LGVATGRRQPPDSPRRIGAGTSDAMAADAVATVGAWEVENGTVSGGQTVPGGGSSWRTRYALTYESMHLLWPSEVCPQRSSESSRAPGNMSATTCAP
jgi:hypothetical protein